MLILENSDPIGAEQNILPWFQDDGSIVDMYGNVISSTERENLITTIDDLPASKRCDDILHASNNSPITIVMGDTGSGKTTQIPKFFHHNNPREQVVVTQPRVLAAMSNARRISQELLAQTGNPIFSLGHHVGYRTGKWVSSKHTSPISLHTDGLELMRQLVAKQFPDVLILDEVHHFSIPTEILGMTLKHRRDVKIIIMSATLDPRIFQEYFSHVSNDIPVIQIEGRTYPIKKYYNPLENYIGSIATAYRSGKNILFFVPGKKEIDANIDALRKELGSSAEIFELHAELPKEYQELLLKNPSGKPRIIVTTNVAEESITIPYIDMVVDLGTHKVARYNRFGIEELRLENTSQANCKQRAGRSGRTKDGTYIRANDTDYNTLHEYPDAPIAREMLDRYILMLLSNGIDILELEAKTMKEGEKLFFHKINHDLLRISVSRLKEIGAIDSRRNITTLGQDLLRLPLNVYEARMILEGITRDCAGDMVYIAAIHEKRGFVSKEGYWKRIDVPGRTESDLLWFAEVFKLLTARELTKAQIKMFLDLGVRKDEMDRFIAFSGDYKLYEVVDFSGMGIKMKRVKEIDETVSDLKDRLKSARIPLHSSDNIDTKKVCIATGSLHDEYIYSRSTKRFHNARHGSGKNVLHFQKGDTTLVEPAGSGNRYLGIPFIVGGTSPEQDDLNLLTFITKVGKYHISEAKKSSSRWWEQSIFDTTKRSDSGHTFTTSRTAGTSEKSRTTTTSAHNTNDTASRRFPEDYSRSTDEVQKNFTTEEELDLLDNELPPKHSIEDSIRNYAAAMEICTGMLRESNVFETDETVIAYYIDHCLVDFMIANNPKIKKYLNNRRSNDDEAIYVFRELFRGFILKRRDEYFGRKRTIHQIERMAEHDVSIFDDFISCTDNPYIVRYIREETIVNLPASGAYKSAFQAPNIDVDGETLSEEELLRRELETEEVLQARKQYARVLANVPKKWRPVQTRELQAAIFSRYLDHVEGDFELSKNLKSIQKAHDTMAQMHTNEVHKSLLALDNVEWAMRERKKLLRELRHRLRFSEALSGILSNGFKEDELLSDTSFFKNQKESYINRYQNAVRLFSSKDPRQQQRGERILQGYLSDVKNTETSIRGEITALNTTISLTQMPIAKSLRDSLDTFFFEFFKKEYFDIRISGKILNLTRAIMRDGVTKNEGVRKILVDFVKKLNFGQSNEFSVLMENVRLYTELWDVLESYKGVIKKDVDSMVDVSVIEARTAQLRENIKQYIVAKDFVEDRIGQIELATGYTNLFANRS